MPSTTTLKRIRVPPDILAHFDDIPRDASRGNNWSPISDAILLKYWRTSIDRKEFIRRFREQFGFGSKSAFTRRCSKLLGKHENI